MRSPIPAQRISPMRKTLLAAVALAPLCLVLGPGVAFATYRVSGSVSEPIATATATNNAPDDIDLTGSVTVTGSTPAVTQNSANGVTSTGSISISGVNNSTNVLLEGGAAGTFANSGTITNNENFSPTDSVNNDGIVEAPFASTTSTGRTGVLVGGSGTGAIVNAGTVSIQGDYSYGISIEAPVTGTITDSGTIALTGDNGVGFRTTLGGTVNGDIILSGSTTATGQNSSAANIGGAVNGTVSIYSSITATGYSTTTRPTSDGELQNIEGTTTNPAGTPADTEKSAAAVLISGNVSGGVLIGAPPVGTTTATATTVDVDADGIPDISEGTGAINVYGNAPALQIGASGLTTTIGNVGNAPGTTDTEPVPNPSTANNYGLIVRGSINSFGIFDGVPATALQIGAPDGTSTVSLTGGVRVVGSITAMSYDADAAAIHIAGGSTVAEVRNEGFIESTVTHSTVVIPNVTTTTGGVTPATAYGILVDSNAALSNITNYGYLTAAATGDNASAAAIVDRGSGLIASGAAGTYTISDTGAIVTTGTGPVTVTNTGPVTLTNEGVISSTITAGVAGDAISGRIVAADFSANTTGVNLVQQANPSPIPIDIETTTTASGTTTTTAAATGIVSGSTVDTTSVTTTSATVTTTVTTTAAGVTTTAVSTTPTVPSIVGDVLLGSGTNNVQLLAGSMTGALDLGSGANSSLVIDNTSGVSGALTSYSGALTYEGSGLTLSVNNGALFNTSPTALRISNLTIGSAGVVYFALNPVAGTATQFQVSGQATLASGAKLGIDLLSPLTSAQSYTVVQTNPGSLNNANSDATVIGAVPYLVNASATTNAAAGTITIGVSNKTTQQLGLTSGETAAFSPVLASLANDPGIEAELLGQYSRAGFLGVYDQLLPDYAGGVFQLALAGSDAITRATSRTNDIENPSGTRGAWAQEFALGIDQSRGDTPGFQGDGFGFVGGLETGGAGFGAFGLTGAFVAGSIRAPHAPGDNSQSISEGELGGYWQGQAGGFKADARVGGGYINYSDRRELLERDASTDAITLDRTAKAGSQGWSATGHFGASYQIGLGKFYLRPEAQGDYFELFEGKLNEHGSTQTASTGTTSDGFDLDIASRTGRQGSFTAALNAGAALGTGFVFRPELEIGYRDVFSGTAGDTTAHFLNGQNFTLLPASITGGGPVARFGLKGDTDFYELDFQAGGEQRDRFVEADVRLNIRVLF